MFHRSLLAGAVFAALIPTAALAADYGPSLACAPPADYIAPPQLQENFKDWNRRADHPRMVYVERYDPRYPPPDPTPLPNHGPDYMPPQTAYLASSLCDFAYGEPRRSWYDGKLFYKPGGISGGPDSFMIIERN